jgi:hypothetical protein
LASNLRGNQLGDVARKEALVNSLTLAEVVVVILACLATGLVTNRYLWREGPEARQRVNSDSAPSRPRTTVPLERDN